MRNYQTCESCLEGRMVKRHFETKGNEAKETLDLKSFKCMWYYEQEARGGYQFLVNFCDNYSSYGCIYVMLHKYEILRNLMNLKWNKRRD